MWVQTVAKWPPARVAIQPPRRRVLERLREVAQGEAVLGELVVERRAEHPGLDPRGPRDRVDLEHPVERAEVDRHRARVASPTRGSTPPTTLVPPP